MKIGLVQINSSFENAEYLPYTVGTLQAYAEHVGAAEGHEFLLPIYKRMPYRLAARQLSNADISFFSIYVWNEQLSLAIAEELKYRYPRQFIVFGGPQVPDSAEGYLRAHAFIDLVVHGEGEVPFAEILNRSSTLYLDGIPSVSWIGPHRETFYSTPRRDRITDLEDVPSPYLKGIFKHLMEANPDESWLALWETNRGCPYSCTFCDWGSAVGAKVTRFPMDRLRGDMDWFAAHKIEFIYCCDANFGLLPRDIEIAEYMANLKCKYGYPKAFSTQNTKNATERAYEVQKTLSDAGLQKGVTLGIQSLDPHTLEEVDRTNISLETYHELQRRFRADGVPTYTDLILALPGETYDSFVEGIATLMEHGQHNRIQFNNLSILPNAKMGDPAYQEKHGFVIVESEVANMHGSASDREEVPELQQLVVGTVTMPPDDWLRARVFCWWVALLHFDKLLQLPIILARAHYGIGYREIIEAFSARPHEGRPQLDAISNLFWDTASGIQNGGPEYIHEPHWLDAWWPADESVFLNLALGRSLPFFYREAGEILASLLPPDADAKPLEHALQDTAELMNLPHLNGYRNLLPRYNLWDFYQAALKGDPIVLEEVNEWRWKVDRTKSLQDWDEWCREVVWYGNKAAAGYMNPVLPL